MKNELFKKWLIAALCVVSLGSRTALAEPDTFGLGTGRNGTLTVSAAGTNYVNSYAQVTGPLAAGDTLVPVGACTGAAACFAAGDLVMVLQTTGLVPEPASGDAALIDLNSTYKEVGRWEFARLASVTAGSMTLTAPLVYDYAANVTQVIRVPEYTFVTINAARNITAPTWDGSTGGVIAFLAQNTFTNNGNVNASAIGFRGGLFVNDDSWDVGCLNTDLDRAAAQGAQKGEGLAITRYGVTHTGRGNVANGGGGGVCYKAGGGGGGNGGAGGIGGNSGDGNRPVGGMGGAAVDGSLLTRLTFGGGGGAGHGDSGSTVAGGRGGGIVFIRANQLAGTGSISASGGSAGMAADDAASGGGAGGTLHLRFATSVSCGSSSVGARGGTGGNSGLVQVGPGGGGGGGRILFQSASGTCSISSSNVGRAAAGTQQDPVAPGGSSYGAQAGVDGVFSRLNTGFPTALPVPTVTAPANGNSTNNRRPLIGGTAQPNTTVVIYIDGVEVGRATSNSVGTYIFAIPTDLAEMSHTVQAAIEVEGVQSARSTANTFTVDLTPPDTVIVSGPPSLFNSPSATFDFSVTVAEPGGTYECSLDGAAFTACADPETFTGLTTEKSYTLQVRAKDAAGNVDLTPASYSWTVDLTPPDTTIVSGPPSLTNATSAAFDFSSEAGATFECSLDGVAFTACADPETFMGLDERTHTLEVRAKDATGNVDPTPASYTWTVDLTPPDTVIVSGPPSLTNATSAAFDFSSEAGVTYECNLDGAGFTACADPQTFTGLMAEKAYTLEVRAKDATGNVDPTPASYTWTVDLTPPDTVIVSGPPSLTNATSATFDFSSAVGATFMCRLDDALTFTPCVDPETFTGLGDGEHRLEVSAVDEVGNMDPTPAVYTWTVDLTLPDTVIVSGPPSVTSSTSATFDFGSSEMGVTYLCSLDGTPPSLCSDPVTITGLIAASHTLEVRAVDAAGNEDPTPASYSWSVEPDTDSDGIPDDVELANGTSPTDDDSDDDGLTDGNEDTNHNGVVDPGETDPRHADSDGDGLQDGLEKGLTSPQGLDTNLAIFNPDADPGSHTDPLRADTDGDGVPDGHEDANHNGRRDPGELNPLGSTDGTDADGDGLDNETEWELGLDPFDGDRDDDGVLDGVDGILDSDGDGFVDALDPDSDNDGVLDGTERGVTLATAPVWTDTRSPHFRPDEDPATITDPHRADTDGDGLLDGDEDHDGNGASDAARGEPDPNNPDTDQDGVSDGEEIQRGTDPLVGSEGGCSATGNSLGGALAVLLLGPSWRQNRSRRHRGARNAR